MTTKTYRREGDEVVAEERFPALVDWQDILAACEVEEDENHDTAPWEKHSGYEHETVLTANLVSYSDKRVFSRGFGNLYTVVIDRDNALDWFGTSPYPGASKQVCAEWFAEQLAAKYEQLVGWRRDGWTWYTVTCDFMGEHGAVYGIDDYDHALKAVAPDVAWEVADALEAKGFSVVGRPAPVSMNLRRRRQEARETNRERCARQNGFACYADYRGFLQHRSNT